jgi:hypothetical protein
MMSMMRAGVSAGILSLGLCPDVFADSEVSRALQERALQQPPQLRMQWEGKLRADYLYQQNKDGAYGNNARLKGFEIKLTDEFARNLFFVVKMKLDRDLVIDGDWKSKRWNWEEFFKEAYLRVRDVGGIHLVDVLIGKHEIAFGQDVEEMPIYHNDPLHGLVEINEVIGFTVVLTNKEFLKVFDKADFSLFETTKGDLDISDRAHVELGSFDGLSVRLTRSLSKALSLNASFAHLGNGSKSSEDRASVGLIFKNGDWTYWAEGLHMKGNSKYSDADFSFETGAARDWGKGRVVVKLSSIQKALKQVGIGYIIPLDKEKATTLAPELRYTDNETGRDGWVLGFRLQHKFKTQGRKKQNALEQEQDSSLEGWDRF